jgi:hypothetical protein
VLLPYMSVVASLTQRTARKRSVQARTNASERNSPDVAIFNGLVFQPRTVS